MARSLLFALPFAASFLEWDLSCQRCCDTGDCSEASMGGDGICCGISNGSATCCPGGAFKCLPCADEFRCYDGALPAPGFCDEFGGLAASPPVSPKPHPRSPSPSRPPTPPPPSPLAAAVGAFSPLAPLVILCISLPLLLIAALVAWLARRCRHPKPGQPKVVSPMYDTMTFTPLLPPNGLRSNGDLQPPLPTTSHCHGQPSEPPVAEAIEVLTAQLVPIELDQANAAEMARLKDEVERMTREAKEAAAAVQVVQEELRRAQAEKDEALRAKTAAEALRAQAEVRAAKEKLAAGVRQATARLQAMPPAEDGGGDGAHSSSSSSSSATTPQHPASVSSTPTWLIEAEEALVRE